MENMQDIFIGDEGRGSPLVLVHGFLGSTEMWRPQIKYFKKILEFCLQHYLVLVKVIITIM